MDKLLAQNEVNYTPDYNGSEGRCASCRWFMPEMDRCYIVKDQPAAILATGRCDRQEMPPTDEDMPEPELEIEIDEAMGDYDEEETAESDGMTDEMPVERREASPISKAVQAVKNLFTSDPEPTGFKVKGNVWLAAWSNNFKDRDGEYFPAKAMDDYAYRVDNGLTPPPELWIYHVKGSRVGQADWVGRHGHFMFAAGTFDDTEKGRQAKAFYEKNAGKTSLSHGFTFDPSQFVDNKYNQFNTFEISLLPRGAEANSYTSLEGVKQMALSESKRQYLKQVMSEDEINGILEKYAAAGKAMEELGAEYKEFTTDPREVATETDAVKSATDDADKKFTELFLEMIGDHAEVLNQNAAMAKELNTVRKSMSEKVSAMADEIDALRAEMELRPRAASKSDGTVLDGDDDRAQKVKQEIDRQTTRKHSFWGTSVSGLEELNNE